MAYIKKNLQISGNSVNYFIRYGNQKNIILRVKEGEIYISAPYHSNDWEVEHLIYKNYHKISKIQINYDFQSKYDLFGSQPWIKIFDNKVNIRLSSENIHPKFVDDEILIKDYYDNNEQLNKLYTFLSKVYKNWFINRSSNWASKMGVEFKNLTVKVMNMKWGVCYPSIKKIVFNTKLLHFKQEIIDYVIVHELTHLLFADHSKRFWHTIENYLPNYKELSKILDKSGI